MGGQSARRKASTCTQTQKTPTHTNIKHPCPEWDSNPRSRLPATVTDHQVPYVGKIQSFHETKNRRVWYTSFFNILNFFCLFPDYLRGTTENNQGYLFNKCIYPTSSSRSLDTLNYPMYLKNCMRHKNRLHKINT
jgi:hypothetical protein